MYNRRSPTKTCWCFTLVQRRQTWLRMKYVSFVVCSLLLYLPHLKGAGNLFAQKASFINCTKDLKQISLLQIFVYFRKMFLGRRRKWSWKIWVDIVLNILPGNFAAVNALKERSLLGQEDHQRSEIVLKSWKYVSLIILFFLDDTLSLLATSHPVHNWTKHPVSLSHTSVHNCTIFLCSLDVGSRWSIQRSQYEEKII